MNKLLEVCVDSLASAQAAISGGADRLELCAALAIGGLTPYTELLRQIRRESDIPVRCLMRPRAGDFCYTPEEIAMTAAQMGELLEAGADGFVIGCLTPAGELDEIAMKPLFEAANGKPLTLHRCIDVSKDPVQTYRAAAALGFDTVLTSGGAATCAAGKETIAAMVREREKIAGPEILVGAGVKASVIQSLLGEMPGLRAFHMSGKADVESAMVFRRENVPMGIPGLDEWHISRTDEEKVRLARRVLDETINKQEML